MIFSLILLTLIWVFPINSVFTSKHITVRQYLRNMAIKKRIMMIGSAEKSAGGVATVIRTMKTMPFWQEYSCYWLGTQIQRNYLWKMIYASKAVIIAAFIMWRYDIIHFHTTPDKIGLLVQMPELLLAKLLKKKIVIEIHVGNQLNEHTNNKLFKWVLQKANLIILLAKQWEQLFKEKYQDINVPTVVLYNACEVNISASFIKEKEKSIIMAAYFNNNKAPDLLLKAWAKIKEKYPDWKITMMGNGEVEYFRQISHQMGLDGCVSFPGYITGIEKENYWRKASIYCMCSYNEGFPMVVLEAWAYKIAVITTPVGGLPDIIEEGKNCLTFPFGNADILAKKLELLIENEQLRYKLAEYSHQFVKRMFSTEKINKNISNIYKSLEII